MGELTLSQLSSQSDLPYSFSTFLLMQIKTKKKLTWLLQNAQGVILVEFFLRKQKQGWGLLWKVQLWRFK